MSGPENKTNKRIDIFSKLLTDKELNNQRAAVRYVRNDITATLRLLGLFNSSKFIPAKLLDISSKGVAIEVKKNISLKTKVILSLTFKSGMNFKVPAKIIYKNITLKQYGVKFEHPNEKLADYLLASQEDLIFK